MAYTYEVFQPLSSLVTSGAGLYGHAIFFDRPRQKTDTELLRRYYREVSRFFLRNFIHMRSASALTAQERQRLEHLFAEVMRVKALLDRSRDSAGADDTDEQ
ncbi:MAG: hypothetical protein AAB932_06140 [Patescibacteria group bacterium]